MQRFDLVISNGKVFDGVAEEAESVDIGIAGGVIRAIDRDLSGSQTAETIDAGDLIVCPGLVDVHTHLFRGVSHYGIDADSNCLARGVTTAIDAGSAGAATVEGFYDYVIRQSETDIRMFLNLSVLGMITPLVGELEDLRYADTTSLVEAYDRYKSHIVGLKIRVDGKVVGESSLPALRTARAVADRLGIPIMVHILGVSDPLPEILMLLRKGDLVTHCFHGGWNGVVDNAGRLVTGVREAMERGVLFDVGHGSGSFSFAVAERALESGLVPDTVSSDLHAYNVQGPVFDLVTTLNKMLYLGLSVPDVLRRATSNPAQAVGVFPGLGSLSVGTRADIALLELQEGHYRLQDSTERSVQSNVRLEPVRVIRAGVPKEVRPADV